VDRGSGYRGGSGRILVEHLVLPIPKGGHSFQRRDIYGNGGTYNVVLEQLHHYEHAKLQLTLQHKIHEGELQLQREMLLTQYWSGVRWTRAEESREPQWRRLGLETTIGEPDLARSLLEVAHVFGEGISFRFVKRS
jgi:hypothetical protein